jgi:hypothetical protein
VTGVDMTEEQLSVANKHVQEYTVKTLGYPKPNMSFKKVKSLLSAFCFLLSPLSSLLSLLSLLLFTLKIVWILSLLYAVCLIAFHGSRVHFLLAYIRAPSCF